MNLLREYINILLKEGMKDPNSITSDYAIWSTYWGEPDNISEGTELDFILYDLESAKTFVKEGIEFVKSESPKDLIAALEYATNDIIKEAIDNSIEAVLRVRIPGGGEYGECNGAWEVTRSAANKGFGPTIYELVMSIAPYGLTSDRSETSTAAQKVWNRYAFGRADVEKRYLDDVDIIVTELPEDDCTLVGNRAADPIKDSMRSMFLEWFSSEHSDWYDLGKAMDNGEWQTLDPDEILNDLLGYMESDAESIEEDHGEHYEDIWQEISDQWYEHRLDNEGDLFNQYPPEETALYKKVQLNLSYNINTSVNAYHEMNSNHLDLITFAGDLGLVGDFDEGGEGVHWSVREFFNEKY